MDWKQAVVIDYTGAGAGNMDASEFGDDVIKHLREPGKSTGQRVAVVLDTARGLKSGKSAAGVQAPRLVRDHINLSGINPLIGPNNPCGDRFPVVNDIYLHECPKQLGALESLVAAGVKPGKEVDSEAMELLHKLGADCYCFHLVPTMLIAAHAGWKILAIVGPEGHDWQKDCISKLLASAN